MSYDREHFHTLVSQALADDRADCDSRGIEWDPHAAATAVLDALEAAGEDVTTVATSDPRPTALLDTDRANFDTLRVAMANDDVALLHAREKATGHGHALLCLMSNPGDGSDDVDVIPVARMLDEDPTETYTNPAEEA